jgi:hypothetical protein
LTAALDRICARPPTPRMTWIHRIHATGGWRGKRLHCHGGDVCCVVLWLCAAVKLIACNKVPEHNLKVCILPYYKVNGVIFCPIYACTIPPFVMTSPDSNWTMRTWNIVSSSSGVQSCSWCFGDHVAKMSQLKHGASIEMEMFRQAQYMNWCKLKKIPDSCETQSRYEYCSMVYLVSYYGLQFHC